MKFSESLKKNDDFRHVYKKANRKASSHLVLYAIPNGTESNRLGISVSKKVGNSVVRHHLTRLIREAYRLHEDSFCIGQDLVVVAREGSSHISYAEVESELMKLAGLLKLTSNYG